MHYLILAILILLLFDLLLSYISVRQAKKLFAKHNLRKVPPPTEFGKGAPFHIAIIGDSTFDVRGDSKIAYGPADVFIHHLSRHHKVYIHMLASQGAKSRDVVALQLPRLKQLERIDLVIAYMGANDVFRLNNPFTVGKSYTTLFKFTEKHNIPVVTSQVASYWYLSIFPLLHRVWLYFAIHIQNMTIRNATKGCSHVALINTKPYHKQLHKKRFKEPYLSDGVHTTDKAALAWGEYMLDLAKQNPATAEALRLSGR